MYFQLLQRSLDLSVTRFPPNAKDVLARPPPFLKIHAIAQEGVVLLRDDVILAPAADKVFVLFAVYQNEFL